MICDGCNVREPWEHRCHGGDTGCACEECREEDRLFGVMSSCDGLCISAGELGLPMNGIAYPHPDCPKHGDAWIPHDNQWSRDYVANHPERFKEKGNNETA